MGGTYEFDTANGNVRRVPDDTPQQHWGIAWKQGRRWFVLHKNESHLVLQQGEHAWPITPEYSVDLKGFWFRRFRIMRGKKVVFRIWYKPKCLGQLASFADPTYDGLDAEADDYFIYVRSMWRSWSERDMAEFNELN